MNDMEYYNCYMKHSYHTKKDHNKKELKYQVHNYNVSMANFQLL